MNISQIYIAASIIALAVIAMLVFVAGKKEKGKRLSLLASAGKVTAAAHNLFGSEDSTRWSNLSHGNICASPTLCTQSKIQEQLRASQNRP